MSPPGAGAGTGGDDRGAPRAGLPDENTERATPPPRAPWRVEGGPQPEDPGKGGPTRMTRRPGFWWLLVVLLAVNWIVAHCPPPSYDAARTPSELPPSTRPTAPGAVRSSGCIPGTFPWHPLT